ncbi:MAG: hypothetical protein JWP32_2167 [Schumannella sp.]|nr:hypothetical protein [Schumannella sp.]
MSDPHRRTSAVSLAIGVLLIASLAGCAPDPVETTPPVAEPTPTPTETEAPVALEPESVLPLGCAQLLSLGFVQDHIPGEVLRVSVDESSAPAGYEEFMTAGGLRCVWGGSGRTDGGYDQGLKLEIVSDGAAGFASWVAQDSPHVAWRTDAYGDRSHTYCADDWQNGCYGGVVVGDYWIDVAVRDSAPRSAATAETRFSELIEPVVNAIRGAGAPRPVWSPSAGSYDGAELCSDAALATDIVGGAVTISPTGPDEYISAAGVVAARAHVTTCTWKSALPELQIINVTVFPAGAWIYPRMVADPAEATPGYLSDAVPAEAPGSDGLLIAQADEVWSAMSINGSLVELRDWSTYEPANLLPVLQRLATQIGR